jgi:hypothetical protein
MAQAKVTAVLRLYDLYRETSQKQFYAGTIAPQSSFLGTSSGGTLQVGPEPDNGVFPGNLGAPGLPDNEWDGYLSLPTVGGLWHSGVPPKAKNTLATTLSYTPNPSLNSAMHVHYTLDTDCCDHPFDRREIAGRVILEDAPPTKPDEVSNYPDVVAGAPLAYGGPYDPTKGNHRLARSFRISGGVAPSLTPYAPSDLRIDGAYAERHSAPAYLMHLGTNHFWDFANGAVMPQAQGMVSFWMKPSFYPELTGKIRKFWDMSRHHDSCGSQINVTPFALVFMPVQYNYGTSEATQPLFWSGNMGKFRPCSMYFGSMQWHADSGQGGSPAHQFGRITDCLNHLGHIGEPPKPSPFRAHRWINATFSWWLNGSDYTGTNSSTIWLNGTQSYAMFSFSTMTGWAAGSSRMMGFDKHCGGAYNHMRIGGTSRISNDAKNIAAISGAYRGNYSSDATIDELYVWKSPSDGAYDALWTSGRYYNIKRQAAGVGSFTSQQISLPPSGGGSVKILGASWTWYGEECNPSTGMRTLNTYRSSIDGATPSGDLQPFVNLSVSDGGLLYGPFSDDGFSPLLNVVGQTPILSNPSQVKYLIDIGFPGGTAADILLGSPVLDDVTLYWSDGAASTRVDTQTPLLITGPGSTTLPDAASGAAYTQTFTAAGAAPVTWTVSDGTLPGGLTLDPASGVLSGSPTQEGTFTFVVTASVGSNSAGTQYTLTVTAPPAAPAGKKKGGSCGLLGGEALLLLLLLRSRGHASRKVARL